MKREPILRSRDCPPELRPRNCSATIKVAEQHGWQWQCKIAIGWPDSEPGTEPMRSIVLSLSHPQFATIHATWAGPVDGEGMGFDGAWIQRADGYWTRLSYNEIKPIITLVPPVPTAKAEADLQLEANQHLLAIGALRPIAWPIAVLRQGIKDRACKGKVSNPDWPGWLPCSNFTSAADEPLCREGCRSGVVGDGTEEPKKPSKKDAKKENTGDLT